MIDVKTAVQAALLHLINLYEDSDIKDILLEEFEMSPDQRFWEVTFGFNVTETEIPSPIDEMLSRVQRTDTGERKKQTRKYKVLRVDADSGHVESMRIKPT